MKNFVLSGKNMTVTAPADALSGDLVVVGAMFGISTYDGKAGTELELDCSGGVYDMAKVNAQAWTQGAPLYWDPATKLVTSVPGSLAKIGVAALAAANPSAVGRVRLNASF